VGIPDDEISLSVLFCVWGFTFVVLGLSHLVAVGSLGRGSVLFGRKKMHFLEILVFWQFVFRILVGFDGPLQSYYHTHNGDASTKKCNKVLNSVFVTHFVFLLKACNMLNAVFKFNKNT
jgi:hypothetical protein